MSHKTTDYSKCPSDKIHFKYGRYTRCGHRIIPIQKIRPVKRVTTDKEKVTCGGCLFALDWKAKWKK